MGSRSVLWALSTPTRSAAALQLARRSAQSSLRGYTKRSHFPASHEEAAYHDDVGQLTTAYTGRLSIGRWSAGPQYLPAYS